MATKVYCLPGTMCDERLWEFTQQALGASLSLQHVPIPMEGSIDSIIDALAEILPQEPIHLLGFSMGGYLACAFALKYAERVKRLMVLSNTASGLLETERHQREVALNWVIKRGYKGIPKKKASAMLGPSKKEKAELIDIIFAMDSAMGEAVFVQQLKSSLDRPDLLLMIAESSFPLYFAVGSDDALLSKAVVEDMQGAKQLDVEVVEGCGHMLPLEQPTVLAELLKEFFP
ncbi:alpha/beta fold hydrolase [Marinomonas rhizomae]|uniref:Pimeloyl-ACP methyl ester carboxylesterase n=1 Tax=Marinomonas rhizomae TaxID=491948 RepID=A0A366J3V4_9GAMM|nr:alpha/beta hydrolase [Marinomonas rhizomae]RBP80628.1 pimeloyl-ACP methyl ester carboxylesterase [Marinomonas rhizomae]